MVVKELVALGDGKGCAALESLRKEIAGDADALSKSIAALEKALDKGQGIIPAMDALRKDVDALETVVDDKVWPMPKYREMLFIC